MPGIRRLVFSLAVLVLAGFAFTWTIASTPLAVSAGQSVGQWRLVGCLRLPNSVVCRDVFEDGSGNLWMCDGCGRTKNPSPGKCRKLTTEEIASGTWCSGGS